MNRKGTRNKRRAFACLSKRSSRSVLSLSPARREGFCYRGKALFGGVGGGALQRRPRDGRGGLRLAVLDTTPNRQRLRRVRFRGGERLVG